nr:MAG TPA: hypothetical protein [Caudoviricetes sp.]
MSTVAERMAEAFKQATGEAVEAPKYLSVTRGKYTLDAVPGYGGCRYVVTATAWVADSLKVEYRAKVQTSSTSVSAMANALREARMRARALASLSDVLGSNGWRVRRLTLTDETALQASMEDSCIQVYGDGTFRGYDDAAVRFGADAFAVALERIRGR